MQNLDWLDHQRIRRHKQRRQTIETDSLRFLKLLWIWSLGSQDLMVHAWETQQNLEEDFCNTEVLDMPMVLQIVREHLSPSHPSYVQEAMFLAYTPKANCQLAASPLD